MNTELEIRVKAKSPIPGAERIEPAAQSPLPKPEAQGPAEPSEAAAYGCVEWFNYQRHRLRQPARKDA